MDMKVTFDSQDRLLKEDFTLPVSICQTCKRTSKLEYIIFVVMVTVSVVTCAVAYICAVYCHQVLKEVQTLHHSVITKHCMGCLTASAQLENTFPSPLSPMSGSEDIIEDYSAADQDNFEVEKFDQKDSGDGEHKVQENDEFAMSKNNGRFIERSVENFNFNSKKPSRQKRSANDEIKKCRKNCRGMNMKDRKTCRKKCGGGKAKRAMRSKFLYQINLPAAHFEANMFDNRARDLVSTTYNTLKSQDEGPLKIFKQAEWVSGPSPFTFSNNSVAQATSAGIFFVYAQAYIGGSEPEKSIIIIQKRNGREINALSCDNGVNQGSGTSGQMQTCAVSGLMKLEKDDTVEIQRSEVTVNISLDKDKTFFGLVQLSGITATSQ